MSLTSTTEVPTAGSEEACTAPDYAIWSVIHAVFILILLVITIVLTHQFRKRQSKNNKRVPKLFCLGMTFSTVTIVSFLLYLALDAACILGISDLVYLVTVILLLMFFIGYWLLVVLFFFTVQHVFKGTEFQLSPTIFNSFIGLLGISIFSLFMVFLAPPGSSLSSFFGMVAGVTCTGLVVFLLLLFSSKLLKLAKIDSNNAKIMSIVAKTNVLLVTSVALTLLDIVVGGFRGDDNRDNHFVNVLYLFISSIDTFTNFLCIMLSYDVFKANYKKICGFFHRRMSSLCLGMANKGVPATQLAQYVNSASRTSADADFTLNSSADKTSPKPTEMTSQNTEAQSRLGSTTEMTVTETNNDTTIETEQ